MKYCHVLVLAFVVAVLCSCGRRATPLPKDFATLGTGPLSGVYYPVGGAICRLMLKDESSKFRLAVEPSDGPVANLAALLKGEMDFGLVPLDILEKAQGQGLRAVFALRLDAGPPVILATTERVDAALVRAVAKAVSYNFDELKASHPSLAGLRQEELFPKLSVPYHPGVPPPR